MGSTPPAVPSSSTRQLRPRKGDATAPPQRPACVPKRRSQRAKPVKTVKTQQSLSPEALVAAALVNSSVTLSSPSTSAESPQLSPKASKKRAEEASSAFTPSPPSERPHQLSEKAKGKQKAVNPSSPATTPTRSTKRRADEASSPLSLPPSPKRHHDRADTSIQHHSSPRREPTPFVVDPPASGSPSSPLPPPPPPLSTESLAGADTALDATATILHRIVMEQQRQTGESSRSAAHQSSLEDDTDFGISPLRQSPPNLPKTPTKSVLRNGKGSRRKTAKKVTYEDMLLAYTERKVQELWAKAEGKIVGLHPSGGVNEENFLESWDTLQNCMQDEQHDRQERRNRRVQRRAPMTPAGSPNSDCHSEVCNSSPTPRSSSSSCAPIVMSRLTVPEIPRHRCLNPINCTCPVTFVAVPFCLARQVVKVLGRRLKFPMPGC